jgi:hypothetical protein
MKLYHGTSLDRGKQILQSLKLKGNNVERVYDKNHMFPTTDGYVFLANLEKAIYYGNITATLRDYNEFLMVFEVDVEESKLLPDLDEIQYTFKNFGVTDVFKDIDNPTVMESLTVCKSVMVSGDILLERGKSRYAKIVSSFVTNVENNYQSYMETKEFVSLIDHDNEYANRFKKEFIDKIHWNIV